MQKAKLAGPTLIEEQKLWQQGYDFVVGLDEVGRGPLAGPVCATAVCLKVFSSPQLKGGLRWGDVKIKNQHLTAPSEHLSSSEERWGIKDSKKLSAVRRETWSEFLTTHADIKWGIGIVSEKIIDQINILQATKLAMKMALEDLEGKMDCHPRENGDPDSLKNDCMGLDYCFCGNDASGKADYLLLDGNFLLDDLSINQKAVVRGDEKIWSCAAASIIAKVTRDRLMKKYHQQWPQYGFDKHKGYGTAAHLAAIKQHGPCAIHRLSFAPFK